MFRVKLVEYLRVKKWNISGEMVHYYIGFHTKGDMCISYMCNLKEGGLLDFIYILNENC